MVHFNGTIVENISTTSVFENRGLHYGDAVFETLRVSAGKILFWEDHYFRLMASMRILRMEITMNFTLEFLEEEIHKLLATSRKNEQTYRVKILVWRTFGGKYTPENHEIEYLITFETLKAPFYLINNEPYEVELFKDHAILASLLSTLKTTNKVVNVLGSIYAEENGYDNCLLLNEKKQVLEALNGNIFLVKGTSIKTPPLEDGCLRGVLRKQLISIIKQLPDYSLEEASISPFELQKADELFITNTIVGIQPISKYRKKEFTATVAKALLAKLNLKARLG